VANAGPLSRVPRARTVLILSLQLRQPPRIGRSRRTPPDGSLEKRGRSLGNRPDQRDVVGTGEAGVGHGGGTRAGALIRLAAAGIPGSLTPRIT
jgi:hypothetical protein